VKRQEGWTLVELLLASSLMMIVLFATLTAMEVFQANHARTTDLINFIDGGRNAMGRLTRDLRGATSGTTTPGAVVSVLTRAGPQDLVMKRVAPFAKPTAANPDGVQTVRWCLAAASGRLHRLAAPGSATPSAACPGAAAGWSDSVVATQVANGPRAVFTYDAIALANISNVSTFLAVDRNPLRPPAEATLTSGVFLRNQNRVPIASFGMVAAAGRNVQLNAQASRDPEGGILKYEWHDGLVLLANANAVASYVAPASGVHSITLTVRDIDGLSASQTQSVTVLP
jgi:type II secretory pathway pseudopilin PulG